MMQIALDGFASAPYGGPDDSLALKHIPPEISNQPAETEMWVFEYLQDKTKLMKAANNVKAPFGWLRRAIEEDC